MGFCDDCYGLKSSIHKQVLYYYWVLEREAGSEPRTAIHVTVHIVHTTIRSILLSSTSCREQ